MRNLGMLHVRHLFLKHRLESGSQEPPVDSHFVPPRLPTELLVRIVDYVLHRKDIFTLSRTSKSLRAITLPLLHHTLDLESWKFQQSEQTRIKLLASMSPDRAASVTTMRIVLHARNLCKERTAIMRSCTCDWVDNILSEALKAMVNLESLRLYCMLCQDEKDHRHRYMADLPTQRLRVLSFYCYCSPSKGTQQDRLLSSPILTKVEALQFYARGPAPMSQLSATALKNPGTLPHLSVMCHHGTELDNTLLATRPIQRICLRDLNRLNPDLTNAFKTCPGSLTHLIMMDFPKLTLITVANPSKFANLQHIGTLPAVPTNDAANAIVSLLAPLQSLRHLASIDASVHEDEDPWDVDLLSRIRAMHPNLRELLCHDNTYFAWQLQGPWWKRRSYFPTFQPWDIISGALDDTRAGWIPHRDMVRLMDASEIYR